MGERDTREHILVVEDDAQLAAQITALLGRAGYAVEHHPHIPPDPPEAYARFALVLLDLNLPNGSGLDLLKRLRTGADVPVLVVTARTDVADKVRALQLGADDFVTKPFWPEELVERVKARLRRPVLVRNDVLERGTLRVDLVARRVFVDGREVRLTPTELGILTALAKRPDAAIPREALAEAAFADHADEDELRDARGALDAHVSRLRKKLGGGFVETVWGVGYRLGGAA
jgi:DNA-binding response OmpR family regulator